MRTADVPVHLVRCNRSVQGRVIPCPLTWITSGCRPDMRLFGGLPNLALQVQSPCGGRMVKPGLPVFWFLWISLCQSGHLCKQPALCSVTPAGPSRCSSPLCARFLRRERRSSKSHSDTCLKICSCLHTTSHTCV